jgi:putative ABC transport system permease protein
MSYPAMAKHQVRHIVLRTLLLFYPRAFRERFGDDLIVMMEEIVGPEKRNGARVGVLPWLRVCWDAATQGSVERATSLSQWVQSRIAPSPISHTGPQSRSATTGGTIGFLDVLATDARQALRSLLMRPGFTLVSALTLAMGIGATTTVFSIFNAVLLQPLPFSEPHRLVALWHAAPGLRPDEINQSPASYFLYRDNNRVFDDLGLWDRGRATITGLDEPQLLASLTVTEGFLPTLGFPMALGRRFTSEDDRPGATGTVVLNHAYWQSEFGSDTDVLGRTLSVNGEPHEVIGVLAPGFPFPEHAILTPARFDRSTVINGDFSYQIIARLQPEVTLDAAQADLERILPRLATEYRGNLTPSVLREGRFTPVVRELRDDFVGDASGPLWILLGTVGIVLLIACANVGNLYMVRAESRQQEVALRTALGAGRGSIVRYFLMESTMLGLLGGAVGLSMAFGGVRMLQRFGPEVLQRVQGLGIDTSVLFFTLGISLLSGLLFGLLPIARYGRPDLVSALKAGGRSSSGGPQQHRMRNGLVVAQIALAMILLVGSGLMLRSFQAMTSVDPGFERPEELVTVSLSFPRIVVPDAATVARQHEEILRALAGIPGVRSSGATTSVPMDGRDSHNSIHFEDFPVASDDLPAVHRTKSIGGDYSETMGIPLVAGRTLTWADLSDRTRRVVVSEDLALRYWPDASSALGRRLGYAPNDWYEIVGVTGPVHDDGLHASAVPIIYFPMVTTNGAGEVAVQRTLTHVVRSTAGSDVVPAVREAIWSINPNLPLAGLGTHAEVIRHSLGQTAFAMGTLAVSAAIALLLGTVGMYSVIAYIVSQRSREIGVRMALGADRDSVGRLVLRHGANLAGMGVGLGILGAFAFSHILSSALFEVSPADPATYAVVAVILTCVSLIACYVPARRATRVDPAIALRGQ